MASKVTVTFLDGTEKKLDWWDIIHHKARANINIRKIVIPKGITIIDSLAFENCTYLEEITFPDTLIEIEDQAFYGCQNLNEIVLPNTVSHIGDYAFAYSGLKKVSVKEPKKDETFFKAISQYNSSSLEFPNNIRFNSNYYFYIGKYAFQRCKELTAITIPDSINRICEGAFMECEKLEKISSSATIKCIANYVFENCRSLKNIPFIENLIEIENGAFAYCSSLEIASFPRSLKKIGGRASYGSGLKKVSFSRENDTPVIIEEKAFSNCKALEKFTFPKGCIVDFYFK